MPNVTPQDFSGNRDPQPNPVRGEKLALLYQGILTATVRIQSGRQPIADVTAFRRQMENLLDEIEREGIKVGYRNADLVDAHYVVIAFLNEAIRRSNDPNRDQFVPLAAKAFPQAVAGEQVFERLKAIRERRDSAELADLLEVFYLCFLLGYEGRYALIGRFELDQLMEDLRHRIEGIRGPQTTLSPEGALPVRSKAAPARSAPERQWQMIALSAAGFALVTWLVLWLILNSYAQGVIGDIGL
jgi:type VI secretion system protein ImpK